MKLNLGCGALYMKGFCNVDIDKGIKADMYFDFNKRPYPIKSNSVDYIICTQVLEHLNLPIDSFLRECQRIMKRTAKMNIQFPNAFFWRNRFAFLFGEFNGTYWAPHHTKLIHPKIFRWAALQSGFSIKTHKTGLSFLPISYSEQNSHYTLTKR